MDINETQKTMSETSLTLYSQKSYFINNVIPLLIFGFGFLTISPIAQIIGLSGSLTIVVILSTSLFFILIENLKIKLYFFYFLFLILITAAIPAMYWQDTRYLISISFLVTAVFLIQFTKNSFSYKLITIASIFMVVVLICAVLGFFLAYNGLGPLFSFYNPMDGRENHFFFTTLTNVYIGNLH